MLLMNRNPHNNFVKGKRGEKVKDLYYEKIRGLLVEQIELLAKKASDPAENSENVACLILAMNELIRTLRTL